MEELVKRLYKIEGGEFHYNDTEYDITSPAGVYKYKNRRYDLWSYVDMLAFDNGINKPTNEWGKEELDIINNLLKNDEDVAITVFNLEVEAYEDMNKYLRIHLFHPELRYLVFNLYSNSHVGLWKAVQYAIRQMILNNELMYDIKQASIIDGKFGRKTANALKVIKTLNIDKQIIFKNYILDGMWEYYRMLAKNMQYSKYLKGWSHRIDNLRKV